MKTVDNISVANKRGHVRSHAENELRTCILKTICVHLDLPLESAADVSDFRREVEVNVRELHTNATLTDQGK